MNRGLNAYLPSDAAKTAGEYFNALPREERAKLAPLLEHYRQMGVAEARDEIRVMARKLDERIDSMKHMFDEVTV